MTKPFRVYFAEKSGILLLIIIFAILLSIAGYMYYNYEAGLLKTDKYNELTTIGGIKAEQISEWYLDEVHDLKIIAQNNGGKWAKFSDKLFDSYVKPDLAELAIEHDYYDVIILDTNGTVISSVNYAEREIEGLAKDSIKSLTLEKSFISTDLYKCDRCNKIHLDLIAPLIIKNGIIEKLLLVRIDPERYLYPLVQTWPAPRRTAETLIIRRESNEVIFLNELRHRPNSTLNQRIPLTETNVPAVRAVMGYEGIWEGNDYRGVEVLASLLRIKETPWYMISKIDREELFEELQFRGVFVVLVVILLVFVSGLSLSFIYQYRQRKIYQKLYVKESALSEKEEEFKTTLYSIGDGVITTDVNSCIKQVNGVAEKLTGWTEDEARGRKLFDVFKIINEKTQLPVENPVDKVLKEGSVVGLANHTLLISKSGNAVPIADSGAPIRNKEGDIVGVVLVFRDQTSERDAENKLLKSERRNRALLEAIPDLMFVLSRDGIFLDYKSPEISKLLLPPSYFIKKHFSEVLPPDLCELTGSYLEKLFETGEVQNFEYQLDVGGELRYFDNRLVFAGENAALSIARDITENKLSQVALSESERSLNFAQEQAKLGSWEIEIGTGKGKWSEQMFRIFGINPEDGIPEVEKYLEHIHPADRELLSATMGQLFSGVDPEIKEFRTNPEIGKVKYLLPTYTVIRDESGNPIKYSGTTLDITELKLTELALKESEEIFRHFMERSPIYIFFKDKNLRSVRLSKNYEIMLGKPLSELLGKHMDELFPSDLAKSMMEDDFKILNEGRLIEVDEEFNGRYYSTMKFPIYLNGNPEYLAGFSIDMTERKKMIEELVEAKNDAEKADKLKFEFLAQMSHEIRTPLNTVLNYTSLLKDEYSIVNDEEIDNIFTSISNASRRVIRTIDLILNISQVTTDAYDYLPRKVDVYKDIILDVEAELLQTAKLKKIELLVKKETDSTVVIVDEYSVSQILINLVENAIKYTKTGFVEISISRNENNKLKIEVVDTGVGMSEEYLDNIYSPFTQEETGYTRRYEGTGLGLHLVKKYCEMNDIEINIRSKKNEGTTFTLLFKE